MAVSVTKPAASKVEPKSPHVSDANIQPFLQPDFDPAEYLNTTLPTLSISTTGTRGRAVPLPDLSAQLQTLLSQLNAQTSRLSNTLTQLTDEIIRSGSRLAYEVEVLRGETLGLTDSFENDLKKDIQTFTPNASARTEEDPTAEDTNGEPPFLTQLRDLTKVRTNLDSVIQTFGSAMQWPLAPSETSITSSFISVSAPENDNRDLEEKGKAYVEKLRSEINDLLASGREGLEAADARIEELAQLAEVWKGTAEEKARLRVVEGLDKLVEDKRKVLEKERVESGRKPGVSPARGYDMRYGNTMEVPGNKRSGTPGNESQASGSGAAGGSGYGFLQNLRNWKDEFTQD